jgi:hypothetical protein
MISEQTETAEPAGEVGRKKKVFDCCGGKVSVRETHIYKEERRNRDNSSDNAWPFFLYYFSIYLTFYERL